MPAIGDVVRVVLSWLLTDGTIMQNVYTIKLTTVNISDWETVTDAIEAWLLSMHASLLVGVSDTVVSTDIELSLRDTVLNQWDSVFQRPYAGLVGSAVGDTLPSLSCATIVAYPDVVRHWGFKNTPPLAESSTGGGVYLPLILADFIVYSIFYAAGWTGGNTAFSSGVFSLFTNTYRAFTGGTKITDVIGSRVTRKQFVGI